MQIRKLLCPVDFSDGSRRALGLAVRLANAHDAELVIANAWYLPPPAIEYTFSNEVYRVYEDDAARGLADALSQAKELGAQRVSSRLLEGLPWQQIVDTAEDCDLVVMATHGRTGLTHVLLGSVAEKVVRHAASSVMTVPMRGELGAFSHVVCAVDFSESSRVAMLRASELVAPGGRITLVHVLELPVAYRGQIPLDFAGELDRRTRDQLAAWAGELGALANVPVTPVCRIGSAGAQIIHVVHEQPCDLVVVGSHGRTGIKRALLGSVAEKVVRHADSPVLVAR